MTLADTDVLIDCLAGVEAAARIARKLLEDGRLTTTSVTRFELLAGARSRKQEDRIRDLLAEIRTLALDADAADLAAQVRRDLEKRGLTIGMADSLIAGTVLANGAELWTRNRRHFERVAHLKLAEFE